MKNIIERFDPFLFVIGILSVIVSIMSLRNPLPTFGMVVVFAAIVSILIGFHKLAFVRPYIDNRGLLIFSGVLDIIIGLLMLFNGWFGILFTTISFAIMFLFDSVFSLWFTNLIKPISKKYFWFDVIFSIIGIIVGIMLLFSPMLSIISVSFLIALLFMEIGIAMIVHSI